MSLVLSFQNFTAADRIRGTSTDEEEELNDTDLAAGNKDTFVLEVKHQKHSLQTVELLFSVTSEGYNLHYAFTTS